MISRILSVFLLVVISSSVHAVPNLVNYQGAVKGPDGQPMSDSCQMRFGLFADAFTTTPVWIETYGPDAKVEVYNGIFNVLLGSITPLPSPKDITDGVWLEVAVDSSGDGVFQNNEIFSPRQQVVSSFYALSAKTLDGKTANELCTSHRMSGHIEVSTDWQTMPNGTYSYTPLEDEKLIIFLRAQGFGITTSDNFIRSKVTINGGLAVETVYQMNPSGYVIQGSDFEVLNINANQDYTFELQAKKDNGSGGSIIDGQALLIFLPR